MQKIELLQGTLDMLILKVLHRGPMHGFAIAERIQQLSDEVLSVGEGSLYPALYRLQDRGWIESEWGQSENNRRAKYYTLTKAGRKQLDNFCGVPRPILKCIQDAPGHFIEAYNGRGWNQKQELAPHGGESPVRRKLELR